MKFSRLLARVSLASLLTGFGAVACGDDDVPPGNDGGRGGEGGQATGGAGGGDVRLTIRFRPRVGDEEFACGATYEDQGSEGTEVTPRDFRLFVSEVRLVNEDGDEVPLTLEERSPFQAEGVTLLDFEDGTEGCSNGNDARNDVVTGHAPAGRYTGIVFSTSVPESLNHDDPATLPAPLQAGGMTWGWLLGFKFVVAELAEVDGEGVGIVHVGSTGCDNTPAGGAGGEGGGPGPDYGSPPETSCAFSNRNEVRLADFDPAAQVIVADLGAIFAAADLGGMSMCHGMGPACDASFAHLGLDYETGEAVDEQRVFRVEDR